MNQIRTEVERLTQDLYAAYLHIECLREENARLYCELEEVKDRG